MREKLGKHIRDAEYTVEAVGYYSSAASEPRHYIARYEVYECAVCNAGRITTDEDGDPWVCDECGGDGEIEKLIDEAERRRDMMEDR